MLHPTRKPATELLVGQVGYVINGMKESKEARVGDTIHLLNAPVDPLPGFKVRGA